jgi:hypothetical protein
LTFLKFLAGVGDLIKVFGIVNVPYSSFRLKNIMADTAFDLTSLAEVCGDLPYSLKEGVKITTDWLNRTSK